MPLLRLLLRLALLPVHHIVRFPYYPPANLVDDQRDDARNEQPKPNANRVRGTPADENRYQPTIAYRTSSTPRRSQL
jgi:hypothetical protein